MTTRELENMVSVMSRGCSSFIVRIIDKYGGVRMRCESHNSLAYDRIHEDIPAKSVSCGYTYKQALQAFYDECKRKQRTNN